MHAATIDKGLPIPDVRGANGMPKGTKLAVWWGMEVGDSVFVPAPTDKEAERAQNRPRSWAFRHGIKWKFTCRTVTENGVKGVRCWRVL